MQICCGCTGDGDVLCLVDACYDSLLSGISNLCCLLVPCGESDCGDNCQQSEQVYVMQLLSALLQRSLASVVAWFMVSISHMHARMLLCVCGIYACQAAASALQHTAAHLQ